MGSLQALMLTAALAAGGGDDTVLLDFTAEWCGPCKTMVTTVQRLEEEGFPIQPIDIDRHPRVAEQWGVSQIPCYILLRNGNEVERVVGAASYDRLLRMFERAGYRIPLSQLADGQKQEIQNDSRPATPIGIIRGQSPDRDERRSATIVREPDPAGAWSAAPLAAPATQYEQVASAGQAEQSALAATVRIWVDDPTGRSCGTGTIVDVHGDEALVVTCGHLFRDSQGRGEIVAELVMAGAEGKVPAQLIAYYADDLDIALISIRPGRPVQAVAVAPSLSGISPGAAAFSVGCDHGGEARVMASRITAVDRYQNRHPQAQNIEAAGQPVDGRSGGGLFDEQGRLIGVCNAADPEDNEGIYAGLRTIHWQLDQIGLARIYQAVPSDVIAASSESLVREPARGALENLPSAAPGSREPIPESSSSALPVLASALESGAEVICVIRGPNQPQGQVVILDATARHALARLTREAQQPAVVRGQDR
jgi:thiol-disulfide isomerase/thioredoxin